MNRSRRHAGNGGDIDDRAVPAACHPLADATRYQECAAQIDVDLAVPIIHAHFFDRMHLAEDAGGIDEAGDGPMRDFDRGNTGEHCRFARDVERFSPEDCLRSLHLLRKDVDDHDLVALLGQ
jgi:hypothetical protein